MLRLKLKLWIMSKHVGMNVGKTEASKVYYINVAKQHGLRLQRARFDRYHF